MNKNEYPQFCEIWQMAHELGVNGKVYSAAAMTEMFEILEAYPLGEVRSALRRHRIENKFAPTLHDVLGILSPKPADLHLGADEAWAIALASMDEAETVAVTDEIMQARAVAWGIWDDGDAAGARMAFRSAYGRLLHDAPPPRWRVSLGHDPARREDAVAKAVAQGLLPPSEMGKYFPGQGEAIALTKLLEQAEAQAAPAPLAEMAQALREQVAAEKLKKEPPPVLDETWWEGVAATAEEAAGTPGELR